MLCTNCVTLSFLYTKKNCIRCQNEVVTNLAVLCESCSNTEKLCSVCLKKTNNVLNKKQGGCGCSKR